VTTWQSPHRTLSDRSCSLSHRAPRCGLLHQSLSPSAVLVSTEDDRIGDKAKGTLCGLRTTLAVLRTLPIATNHGSLMR